MFEIIFLGKNLPPSILTGPKKEDSGIENKTKILKCDVLADKSDLQILWYKDDKQISTSAKGYKYLNDGGLEMSNIQRKYEGTYHCTATTKHGTTVSDKGLFKVKCKYKHVLLTLSHSLYIYVYQFATN